MTVGKFLIILGVADDKGRMSTKTYPTSAIDDVTVKACRELFKEDRDQDAKFFMQVNIEHWHQWLTQYQEDTFVSEMKKKISDIEWEQYVRLRAKFEE